MLKANNLPTTVPVKLKHLEAIAVDCAMRITTELAKDVNASVLADMITETFTINMRTMLAGDMEPCHTQEYEDCPIITKVPGTDWKAGIAVLLRCAGLTAMADRLSPLVEVETVVKRITKHYRVYPGINVPKDVRTLSVTMD